MNHESFIKKIYNFILRAGTTTLVDILIGIGLSFLFLAIVFQNASDIIQVTLLTLGFFFWGLAGLPIIINREVNITVISFDGFPALLIGIVLSLSGFLLSAMFFMSILRLLLK